MNTYFNKNIIMNSSKLNNISDIISEIIESDKKLINMLIFKQKYVENSDIPRPPPPLIEPIPISENCCFNFLFQDSTKIIPLNSNTKSTEDIINEDEEFWSETSCFLPVR